MFPQPFSYQFLPPLVPECHASGRAREQRGVIVPVVALTPAWLSLSTSLLVAPSKTCMRRKSDRRPDQPSPAGLFFESSHIGAMRRFAYALCCNPSRLTDIFYHSLRIFVYSPRPHSSQPTRLLPYSKSRDNDYDLLGQTCPIHHPASHYPDVVIPPILYPARPLSHPLPHHHCSLIYHPMGRIPHPPPHMDLPTLSSLGENTLWHPV